MTQVDSIATKPASASASPPASKRICVHLRGTLRGDMRALRNVLALAQAGYDVSIVDFEDDPTRVEEKETHGVKVTHIYAPDWFEPSFVKLRIFKKLLRMTLQGSIHLLKTPADVYHAGDLRALPATYIAALLRRKPLIYESYEMPLVQPYLTSHRFIRRVAVMLLKMMLRRCDGVVVTSPYHGTELQRRYGGPVPTLVRNIPVYQSPLASDRLRRCLNLGAETRIALYQGLFLKGRSLDRLVYAARFLAPNQVIVLMGSGEAQPQLEALICEQGVGDRVKILPPVPHYEDLLEWTASADLGLVMYAPGWSVSVQLCLPNKLFEYLMAGLPVLATSLDAIVDIIKTYDVGCVVGSEDPAGLGRAISRMLATDPSVLARMRRNALAACRNTLSWEKEQQRLTGLYALILGVPPQAGDELLSE